MQPEKRLSHFLFLPELKLIQKIQTGFGVNEYVLKKVSKAEVCPKCATLSSSLYDKRVVRVHDAPIRGNNIYLKINKRRFYCKNCRKPFTESIQGIQPKKRTTERFAREILWAYGIFSDLTKIRRQYRCSNGFIYKTVRRHLNINLKRHLNYSWPKTIGIDEHFYSRSKGYSQFATVMIDYTHKRPFEMVDGKIVGEIINKIKHIPGRENVENIVLDLSDPYKKLAKDHFPNAKVIADKFHVLRLLNPHIL